jgi:hypothetical protein
MQGKGCLKPTRSLRFCVTRFKAPELVYVRRSEFYKQATVSKLAVIHSKNGGVKQMTVP